MIVTPKRNLLQRALNRALHPVGIKPFPVRFESDLPEAGADPGTVFDAVYAANYWESAESKSGPGSEIEKTEMYRAQFTEALRDLNVKSMLDAPCGDLNWMTRVLDQVELDYIGGDIAEEAVKSARARRPDLDIRRFNICEDQFPDVDLWHCRDTMFHLSFNDIWKALARAKASKIKFAAITTNRAIFLRNLDIQTGGMRLLDFERPPFNFPRPLRYLKDYHPGEFPRFVAIWRVADIPPVSS